MKAHFSEVSHIVQHVQQSCVVVVINRLWPVKFSKKKKKR